MNMHIKKNSDFENIIVMYKCYYLFTTGFRWNATRTCTTKYNLIYIIHIVYIIKEIISSVERYQDTFIRILFIDINLII